MESASRRREVGLRGQRAAKGDAMFFAAGERAGFGFEGWSVERVRESLDTGVEVPAVGVFDEVEEVGEFGFGALAVFVFRNGFDDVVGTSRDAFVDGFPWVEFEFLGEGADAQSPAAGDFAGVGLVLAGENSEKRGLAAAVAADETGLFASRDRDRHAVEKVLVSVGEADFVGGEESGHFRWSELRVESDELIPCTCGGSQ